MMPLVGVYLLDALENFGGISFCARQWCRYTLEWLSILMHVLDKLRLQVLDHPRFFELIPAVRDVGILVVEASEKSPSPTRNIHELCMQTMNTERQIHDVKCRTEVHRNKLKKTCWFTQRHSNKQTESDTGIITPQQLLLWRHDRRRAWQSELWREWQKHTNTDGQNDTVT